MGYMQTLKSSRSRPLLQVRAHRGSGLDREAFWIQAHYGGSASTGAAWIHADAEKLAVETAPTSLCAPGERS